MPAEVHFDAEQGLWIIVCRDPFRREDVRAAVAVIESGLPGPADGPALWDARQVDLSRVRAGHMRSVIGNPRPPEIDRRGKARIAVLVGNSVGYGVARIYEVYSEKMNQTVRAFEDLGPACAWLRELPEPAAP